MSEVCAIGRCFGTTYSLFTRPAILQLLILMLKYTWATMRHGQGTTNRRLMLLKPSMDVNYDSVDTDGLWNDAMDTTMSRSSLQMYHRV